MKGKISSFERRASDYQAGSQSLSRKYNRVATVRILVFVIFLIALVWLANAGIGTAVGIILVLFPVGFGLIVRYHNKVRFERDQQKFLAQINEEELVRLEGKLSQFDPGTPYLDQQHPFVNDLDIFGKNSLFQLLNRTTTPSGRTLLAEWLKAPAAKKTIINRQNAIRELKDMLDWRQDFQALGLHGQDEKQDIGKLSRWLKEPPRLMHSAVYRILGWTLPITTIALIILSVTMSVSIYLTLGILLINSLVLRRMLDYVKKITEDTSANVGLLKAYSRLIQKIEHSTFADQHLNHLQQAFKHTGFSASSSIARLQQILDFLNSRANMFYVLIDVILMIDIHLVLATENWKKKNEHDVSLWFERIGEFEVLCSLAAFAYANKDYAFPAISDDLFHFEAQAMGHPLIHAPERVSNNFDLQGKGSIAVVTGSNMSGKSTFLRTIGINTVLALCGAPVCAERMSVSVLQVFTGMRTQDNLEEHVSSFYAELRRIRQLLHSVEEEKQPLLFMLDEILKGTNSKDRHLGSVSLIKQLSEAHAFGLVSTHDLELGNMAEEIKSVCNFSFNSSIEDDEILFDYKLSPEVCHSFNASKLMEKMGIRIDRS